MSDGEDLDAQLASMEEAAPITPEPQDGAPAGDGTAPADPALNADPAVADPAKPQQQRAPLTQEELTQRYENTKTALRQERQARREALAQQQQMEAAFQAAMARLNQPQQPQQQPRTTPYTNDELLKMGYTAEEILLWERDNRIAQEQQQAAKQQREANERAQRERTATDLQRKMEDAETDFREDYPDYGEAVDYLTKHWDAQFEAMGYQPQERAQIINNIAWNAVGTALQQGKNPAEALYNVAKRVGFAGGAAAQPAPAQPAGKNLQPSQPGPGAQKLAALQAGQAAAQTLSGGGTGGAGNGMSLKAIAQLKGAAFDAAMDKLLRDSR